MDPAEQAVYPGITPDDVAQLKQIERIHTWWTTRPVKNLASLLVPSHHWTVDHLNYLRVIDHQEVDINSVIPYLPDMDDPAMQKVTASLFIDNEQGMSTGLKCAQYMELSKMNPVTQPYASFWKYLSEYNGTTEGYVRGFTGRWGGINGLVREFILASAATIVKDRHYGGECFNFSKGKLQYNWEICEGLDKGGYSEPSLPMSVRRKTIYSYAYSRVCLPDTARYGSMEFRAPVLSVKVRGEDKDCLTSEEVLAEDMAEIMSIFMNRTDLEKQDRRYKEAYVISVRGAILYFRSARSPSKNYLAGIKNGRSPNPKYFLPVRTSRGFDLRKNEDRIEAARGIMGIWSRYAAGMDDAYLDRV